ncbi:hypothetical protein EV127DRAFT_466272 [Xylaria flabelliformis]|nr:hypothetical protein EV127DRAFT_466272 [Xylaria flabelliformis]
MAQLRDTPSQYKTHSPYPSKLLACSPPIFEAIQSATLRTDVNRLSLLERLPNELQLMVIVQIADPPSVLRLALTGPQLCAFILIHERRIAESVVRKTIPAELLHLAVATYTVIESYWNIHNNQFYLGSSQELSNFYVDSVVEFVERYRCSGGFAFEIQHPEGLSLYEAQCYYVMNNLISDYANQLALLSMRNIPKDLRFAPEISPTVLIRYKKALYITQLVAELFAWRGGDQTNRMHLAWGMFWYALAPWEVEQVYCVQTLLTWHILEAYNHWFSTVERFVNYYGPVRLGVLANGGTPHQLIIALKAFKEWNPFEFIYYGHCAPTFGLKLILDRIGQRLAQSTKDGSPAFSDIDLGPMKNWYRIFLFGSLEEVRPGRCHSFFSCMHCLVLSGYAFWDEMDQNRMPTPSISVMHERTVAKFEDESRTLGSLHKDRIAAMRFRWWENCNSQSVMFPHARGQLQLPPRYADEYCFQRIGQTLADEKESTR